MALIHWDGSTARVFEIAERTSGDAWIGSPPEIPQEALDAIASAAPECGAD